ncbi:MAG: hypothetical protein K6L76_12610 [Agarilytica sp.]
MKRNGFLFIFVFLWSSLVYAQCKNPVVLVHGNGVEPKDFNYLRDALINIDYAENEIIMPSWGKKGLSGVHVNDHDGAELESVTEGLLAALETSCSGKIDVVAHSMGNTIAGKAIIDAKLGQQVEHFISISGGWRGVNGCASWLGGDYFTPACNKRTGLYPINGFKNSDHNHLLREIANSTFAEKIYPIYSNYDEILCGSILQFGFYAKKPRPDYCSPINSNEHTGLPLGGGDIAKPYILDSNEKMNRFLATIHNDTPEDTLEYQLKILANKIE